MFVKYHTCAIWATSVSSLFTRCAEKLRIAESMQNIAQILRVAKRLITVNSGHDFGHESNKVQLLFIIISLEYV